MAKLTLCNFRKAACLAVFVSGLFSADAFLTSSFATRNAPRLSLKMADQTDEVITIKGPRGAEAVIHSFGACVTSFKPSSSDKDVLFVRPDAKLDGSKPISGGIPHCFPQFGPGAIQQHGFARNCYWEVSKIEGDDESAPTGVEMKLTPNEYTKGMWDYDFSATYTVGITKRGSLNTRLTIENPSSQSKPFDMTLALHTYFGVGDVDDIVIEGGFKGKKQVDRMQDPPVETTMAVDAVFIRDETDRVYPGVTGEIKIYDNANARTIEVDSGGYWEDTVVWSPYGDEGMGYKNFVCVESAKALEPVTLSPGDIWEATMNVAVAPL